MKILYDADSDSRQQEYPSHFPWDNPYFPLGNGTDSGEKRQRGASYPYPGIPFPFPRGIFPQSSERFIEELLNIPDIAAEKSETDGEGNLIIRVRSTVTGTRCNKCGRDTDKPYGHGREIMLRHLSVFGRKTYICISPPRYQCTCCEGTPVTTQKASWYEQRSPHTAAYEEHVLLQTVSSTVEDVSIKEDLGYEAVNGIITRRIAAGIVWDEIADIGVIGSDEISLKKGHKDFVTIVSALSDGEIIILAVLGDRKKETVKKFLKTVPKRLRKKIRGICSDMYDGFINAAKEVFGKRIIIIADRFHVVKLYRKDPDGLRKKEMKRLKKELPEDEYGKLKNAMRILRKKEKNLKDEEKEVPECLFRHSPELKLAYDICKELTDIFEADISKSEAERKIRKWKT
ncbi:ISL3 family transposase, partial [Desulfococcaceae bacterium HSG8]|nr:ISL3 family transposase [Desulfococcaceae bacterium HSG8]